MKHIPTTPTPGPPHRSCSWAASSRSHTVTGLVFFRASIENSHEMQAGPSDLSMAEADGAAPGFPKRWGSTAVHPMAATLRPKPATFGVIPGISAITITAGPEPTR